MFLGPNNEKTTSDFIMCVCAYSKYIHLQNKSKTNDFRYQISRLFDLLNVTDTGNIAMTIVEKTWNYFVWRHCYQNINLPASDI